MENFNNYTEAEKAAGLYFIKEFGYKSGVGIESENGNKIEFYSKDDPAMDDTFVCLINS